MPMQWNKYHALGLGLEGSLGLDPYSRLRAKKLIEFKKEFNDKKLTKNDTSKFIAEMVHLSLGIKEEDLDIISKSEQPIKILLEIMRKIKSNQNDNAREKELGQFYNELGQLDFNNMTPFDYLENVDHDKVKKNKRDFSDKVEETHKLNALKIEVLNKAIAGQVTGFENMFAVKYGVTDALGPFPLHQ